MTYHIRYNAPRRAAPDSRVEHIFSLQRALDAKPSIVILQCTIRACRTHKGKL